MRIDRFSRAARGTVILALVTLSLSFLVPLPESRAQGSTIINEIRIDQPSADNDEYFELFGPAGSLDGLTYLVIGDGTGGSGVIEAVIGLTGYAIPGDNYFLVAEDSDTFGASADLITTLNFENDDNVTHLLVSGFTGSNGDDLDTDDDGTLDITPWTEVLSLIALIEEENPPSGTEYHYGPPTVGPDGSSVPGHVYRCSVGWQIGQFDPAGGDDTPGTINSGCPTAVSIASQKASPASLPPATMPVALGLAVALTGSSYLVWRRRK